MINTVMFKSEPRYFDKEKAGTKPNTVREIDDDERFIMLREWERTGNYGFIQIQNTDTGEVFSRHVTDVTFFEDRVIISWRHVITIPRFV